MEFTEREGSYIALSIGIAIGDRIKVGESIIQVRSTAHPNLIIITVDDGPEIVVSDMDKKELLPWLPGVFVFSGIGATGGTNRLAFEAPRVIRISRMDGRGNQ